MNYDAQITLIVIVAVAGAGLQTCLPQWRRKMLERKNARLIARIGELNMRISGRIAELRLSMYEIESGFPQFRIHEYEKMLTRRMARLEKLSPACRADDVKTLKDIGRDLVFSVKLLEMAEEELQGFTCKAGRGH